MAAPALGRALQKFAPLASQQQKAPFLLKGSVGPGFLRCTCSLVLAERSPVDFTSIAAAQQFKLPVDLVVAGPVDEALLSRYRRTAGVRRVLQCTHSSLKHLPADATAAFLLHLNTREKPEVICAASGTVGKDVLPRLGGLLDVQPVTDVVAVQASRNVFTRPVYAGNALQTLRARGSPKVLTFRAAAFSPAPVSRSDPCPLENVEFEASTRVTLISEDLEDPNKPQLSTAAVVVSGGRGIRTKADFHKLLGPLRKKLGAALGATRAVVDLEFVPNDLQVGQTGKIVAPKLYVAVGLSGAVQHLAGMRSAKVVVAINKDADAPICKASDFYLVGDLYKIIPELTEKLQQQT
ncbi:hypothetical protein Efla_004254 [Eimeria flavescens]